MVALKIVKIPNKETLDPIHNISITFLITLSELSILSKIWDIFQPCFWRQKRGF